MGILKLFGDSVGSSTIKQAHWVHFKTVIVDFYLLVNNIGAIMPLNILALRKIALGSLESAFDGEPLIRGLWCSLVLFGEVSNHARCS